MPGALSSLKILDFTTLLPGPFGTMLMADMGADIIRVESPLRPDLVRLLPPIVDGASATHRFINRSKRSLAINLKTEAGVKVIQELVQSYDIVVEQFRPGVMERLGLGYEDLKSFNPALIYCSISGYGQTGPYRDRAEHDINYLSVAGVTYSNGRKSTGPAPMSLQVADVAGGSYHGVMGILAAVIHRQQTGEGQYVDISLTDAAFSMQISTAPNSLVAGVEPELEEMIFNGGTFYDCYETQDGRHLSIAGIETHFFENICQTLGHPEWSCHALSPDPDVQLMLKTEFTAIIRTKTLAEWEQVFMGVDSCTEPVLSFSEACDHPQIKARELLVKVGEKGSEQVQLACPIKFSETPPSYRFAGVAPGEHNMEILGELGYTSDEINHFNKQP
jgi:alpha-methylacyl-CoA racemase